jgi:hypothetical protein
MYKTIYCIFLSIGNNIIFNYYLFMFAMFPNYFKQSVVDAKKTSDSLYNSLMFLHFNDDIYKKYHINLMDIHANIMKMINENKMMIKNNDDNNNDDEDNISIMSDLSESSSLTDFFDE